MTFNKLKSKNAKNAGWIIGEQIFQMLISFLLGIVTARYLGPSNYGALNYTASFIAFATTIATLGMDGVVIRKIISSPDKEGLYLGSCIVFRIISAILSSISILILVYILNIDENVKLWLTALQSIQLIFQAGYLFDVWFQRHLQSRFVSIAKIIACIVVSLYKIYLLATSKDIVWFAFSNSLTYIIVSIILYITYKKAGGQKLKFSYKVGKEVLSESYHFIISGIMVGIYAQISKIITGEFCSDSDLGCFVMASMLGSMWVFVPNAIITSMRPTIMEYKERKQEDLYMKRLQQLYSFVIWLSILAAIVIGLGANFIINTLYGEDYSGAILLLKILIWSELFSLIGVIRGIWILCEKKNKYVKYYLAIGALFNITMNLLLVPIFGITATCIVTVLTQIVTSTISPLFFKETRIHTKIVLDSFLLKWYFNKNYLTINNTTNINK